MGEHHISAAVEAVLHSDWSAGETPSGQVPHVHCPCSDGAAQSIPARRGSQTPAKVREPTVQIPGMNQAVHQSADPDTFMSYFHCHQRGAVPDVNKSKHNDMMQSDKILRLYFLHYPFNHNSIMTEMVLTVCQIISQL